MLLIASTRRIDFTSFHSPRGGARSHGHRLVLKNRASVKRRGVKSILRKSRSAANSHSAVWSRQEILTHAVWQPQILLSNWLLPRLGITRMKSSQNQVRPDRSVLSAVIADSQIVVLAPSTITRDLPAGFDDVDIAILEWITTEDVRLL